MKRFIKKNLKKMITKNYTTPMHANFQQRMTKKTKLFHIGSISPLTQKNNADFLFNSIEALCELGFFISILAEGDLESQKKCFHFAKKYPYQFKILESIPQNQEKILQSSNIIVFTNEPKKEDLKQIIKNGIVPIMPYNKKFIEFDPQQEKGNSFLFQENNFWQFLASIIRASENFKFSYDWKNLQKNVKAMVL